MSWFHIYKYRLDNILNLILTVTLPKLRILRKLETLRETGKIDSLIWVKGHFGCEGNTMADKYAKKAIINNNRKRTYHYLNIGLKIWSKQKMIKTWKQQWTDRQTRKGRHYSLVQPVLQGPGPWFGEMEGTRDLHYINTEHICKINPSAIQHIILCCPKHKLHR